MVSVWVAIKLYRGMIDPGTLKVGDIVRVELSPSGVDSFTGDSGLVATVKLTTIKIGAMYSRSSQMWTGIIIEPPTGKHSPLSHLSIGINSPRS